ncbi:MAG: hypothetical protein QXQ53_05790 [Candidatus Methanosuratincola sp.]
MASGWGPIQAFYDCQAIFGSFAARRERAYAECEYSHGPKLRHRHRPEQASSFGVAEFYW